MKHTTLFPPAGGEPIQAHPTRVEYLKSKGWSETKPKAKAKSKSKEVK